MQFLRNYTALYNILSYIFKMWAIYVNMQHFHVLPYMFVNVSLYVHTIFDISNKIGYSNLVQTLCSKCGSRFTSFSPRSFKKEILWPSSLIPNGCKLLKVKAFSFISFKVITLMEWIHSFRKPFENKIAGPPREARQPRLGPWLDFEN